MGLGHQIHPPRREIDVFRLTLAVVGLVVAGFGGYLLYCRIRPAGKDGSR